MLDMSFVFAPYLYTALENERKMDFDGKRWLRRLREFQARDKAKVVAARTVVVTSPDHLAGPHRF